MQLNNNCCHVYINPKSRNYKNPSWWRNKNFLQYSYHSTTILYKNIFDDVYTNTQTTHTLTTLRSVFLDEWTARLELELRFLSSSLDTLAWPTRFQLLFLITGMFDKGSRTVLTKTLVPTSSVLMCACWIIKQPYSIPLVLWKSTVKQEMILARVVLNLIR